MSGAVLSQPLIGYRAWLVRGTELCALDSNPWPVGDVTARCRKTSEHAAPTTDCGCGLYALHRLPDRVEPDCVVGVVVAWGAVELHADGFRAEHARPIALARSQTVAQDLECVARRYRIPLVDRDVLPVVAGEHGASVPPPLLPAGLHLVGCLASALRRRERCFPPHGLFDASHDRFLYRVLADLEHHADPVQLDELLRDAWRDDVDRTPNHPGRALAMLSEVLERTLVDTTDASAPHTRELLDALEATHGPVHQTVVEMTRRVGPAAVPDSYLLRPEIIDALGTPALQRAEEILTGGDSEGLLPWAGGSALLALEPSLSDEAVKRYIVRVGQSFCVDEVLRRARDRRPRLAAFVLEHGNAFGAGVATELLGHQARPALRRLLHTDPWTMRMWTPLMRDLVGPTELRLASARAKKRATNANAVISALAMLPGDEAREELSTLARRIAGLHPSPRARAWNSICTTPHLLQLLDKNAVTIALHDEGLAPRNHVALVRAHPDAEHARAQQLWRHADLTAMTALHVLRATGKVRARLARDAIDNAEQAKTDGRAAARLAAALAGEAERRTHPPASEEFARDPDLPATVRAIAAHITGAIDAPENDAAMRRYRAWRQTFRPSAADPARDLLTGIWQERTASC